jgi:alkanesulfonate monooxygenase SsuD/methylene tetrahydromethanopterin reductase-like flavin-dependent oxidoreductase (luciferase family)
MNEFIGIYREAWRSAGHPGRGKVMLAIHMFCDEDRDRAIAIARDPVERYFSGLVEGARGWLQGASTANYPNYDKFIAILAGETLESQMEKCAAWIGRPTDLIELIRDYDHAIGGFEAASLQVNFTSIAHADADRSVRLFGEQVIPRLAGRTTA